VQALRLHELCYLLQLCCCLGKGRIACWREGNDELAEVRLEAEVALGRRVDGLKARRQGRGSVRLGDGLPQQRKSD
jgi:hypothetical protein